jgi:hypothetical protein
MKKKPSKKNESKPSGWWSKVKPFYKKHPVASTILVLVLVILLAQGIWTIVHNRQAAHQKQQFLVLADQLDKINDQIVAQLGNQASTKSDKYCEYTSVEFGRGERTCTVSRDFYYNLNGSSPSTFADRLYDTLARSSIVTALHKDAHISTPSILGASFLIDNHKQHCGVEIIDADTEDNPDYIGYPGFILPDRSKNRAPGISGSLTCTAAAVSEIFPVRD